MAEHPNRAEAGAPLEEGDASFQQLLKAAGVSEDYTKGDNEEVLQEVANALLEHKKWKEQRGQVPDQYDFSLPADIKHPDGAAWKPDPDLVAEVTRIAKEDGLGQSTISKLTGAYAKHSLKRVGEQKNAADKQKQAMQGEMEKLGPGGADRIAAVDKYMEANYGGKASEHGASRRIEILEDLIARAEGSGRSSPTRPGTTGKRSNAALVGQKGGAQALLRAADERKQR